MGQAQSELPVPHDFGPAGGLDRAALHDVPWMATLERLGQRLECAVDGPRLRAFVASASDAELHCCRSFHRAWLAYAPAAASPGDEVEESKQFAACVFVLLGQQPALLLQFYVMLHLSWVSLVRVRMCGRACMH